MARRTKLADGRQFLFAPGDQCQQELLAYAEEQTKRLLVWDFAYTLVSLALIQVAAMTAHIPTEALVDASQWRSNRGSAAVKKVLRNGGPLGPVSVIPTTSQAHGINHMKAIIGDSSVLYGSYNFTAAAARENNVLVIDPSPEVVAAFLAEYQSLRAWALAHPQPASIPFLDRIRRLIGNPTTPRI